MSQEVADLYVLLRGNATGLIKSVDEAGVASERADGKIASLGAGVAKMSLGVAAAAVAVGVESVKLASSFDRAMEQIHTLAGVPQASIKSLGNGVLALAGQVGLSPDSLAEALYHVESSFASTGITGKKALDLLTVAAKGAQIGHANLVDVTNALDAAVVSGIPGVQNMGQAMGGLLATVGSGDMTMQDFANAASTGVLAVAKVYGASLTDVGAALATFGDNNIRGQNAATDLRMSIMDLTKQAAPGQKALEGIGIASGQLGRDMQTGGLNKALTDLHTHLLAAGDGGTKMGAVLEDAFTKKSSAPLAILLSQFPRLESKYADIAKGAHSFASDWAATAQQFSVQMEMLKAQGEAWAIMLGNDLIPKLSKLISWVMQGIKWFQQHAAVTKELSNVFRVFLTGALVIAAAALVEIAADAIVAAAPFIALSLAIGEAVQYLMNLWQTNAGFRAEVERVIDAVKSGFLVALADLKTAYADTTAAVGTAINAVNGWLTQHRNQFQSMYSSIEGIVRGLVAVFTSTYQLITAEINIFVTTAKFIWEHFGNLITTLAETFLQNAWDTFVRVFNGIAETVRGALKVIQGVFDVFVGIFTLNWSKAWHGIETIVSGAGDVLKGLMKLVWAAILSVWDGAGTMLFEIGQHIISGLTNGIRSAAGSVVGEIKHIATSIPSGLASFLDMHSPSKVTYQHGVWVVEGLVNGMRDKWSAVGPAQINTIAASLKAKMAAASTAVQTAVSARNSQAASTSSSVMGGFNISSAGTGTDSSGNATAVTSDSILQDMQTKMVQAQQFAAQLKQLQSEGLNKNYIDQLATAGPAQAASQVAALATASQGQVALLNAQFGAMSSAAQSIGTTDGDAMFQGGVTAAQKLVNGLKSQEDALVAQAGSMGTAMALAITKALGLANMPVTVGQFASGDAGLKTPAPVAHKAPAAKAGNTYNIHTTAGTNVKQLVSAIEYNSRLHG